MRERRAGELGQKGRAWISEDLGGVRAGGQQFQLKAFGLPERL